jgi:3-phenylpropionate/cinnamic acid dioxygenase small subunit
MTGSDGPLSSQELSDRLLIQDLLTRYATAIDARDWELLDRVFLPDAEIDYTASGGVRGRYPEVRTWLERALGQFAMSQHLIANPAVELSGDRARARSLLYNPMGVRREDGSLHLFFVGGSYEDELVRTPAGWRIARRVERQAWLHGQLPPGLVIPD